MITVRINLSEGVVIDQDKNAGVLLQQQLEGLLLPSNLIVDVWPEYERVTMAKATFDSSVAAQEALSTIAELFKLENVIDVSFDQIEEVLWQQFQQLRLGTE